MRWCSATPTRTNTSASSATRNPRRCKTASSWCSALQPARLRGGADLREARSSRALQNVHIAPHTLRVASIFAILSRLEPSKKASMSLIKKMKLYDGEEVEGYKHKDVTELQEETVREGMDGISPRYIIDRLSNALIRQGVTCINPINALRALRDGFDQHTAFTRRSASAISTSSPRRAANTTRWPRKRCSAPSSTPSRSRPAPCSTTISTTWRRSAARRK